MYRNVDARDLLDAFLVSAISSLLLLRFYLYAAGYPQISNSTFHIAHILWGGLIMSAAIIINLAFLGNRRRWLSAILGGIGFGVFIDELGKIITKDNNYFFQPTIGIIYAIFVSLYLLFNFLTRKQKLGSREYHMNVLAKLEEAVAYDLSRAEKADIKAMLHASDQKDAITKALRDFVNQLTITATETKSASKFVLFKRKTSRLYERFWSLQDTHFNVRMLFTITTLLIATGIGLTVYANINDVKEFFNGNPTYSQEVLLGQVMSATVAGGFVLYGMGQLSSSRIRAFEQFRRAALITIYLTQFFAFIRFEFRALPGLFISIILLVAITFVIHQEQRLGPRTDEIK